MFVKAVTTYTREMCGVEYSLGADAFAPYTGTMMRKVLLWGWVPVCAAFLYTGWVLYSRNAENRQIDAERERSRAKDDAAIVEKLGGGELKVVAFYANPPKIRAGSKGLLCYGVVNAKTVRIEPVVADVGPALSRCVDAAPTKSTTYTLIAQDEQGKGIHSTTTITVE